MAMAPSVRLLVPTRIFTGQRFSARVVLDCPTLVAVRGLEVRLEGHAASYDDTQLGQTVHRSLFTTAVARPVSHRCMLSPGRHRFSVHFEIPRGMPGTYLGDQLRIEYSCQVRLSMPWSLGTKPRFNLHVVDPGLASAEQRALVYVTDVRGPPKRSAYAEVSLGATDLRPGQELHAAVALSNVEFNDYKNLRFTLISVEELPTLMGSRTNHLRRAVWNIPLQHVEEGQPLRVRLRLPERLTPGFSVGEVSLQWFLELSADVARAAGLKLWIPVRVVGSRATEQQMQQAPRAVGSDRLALVWRSVSRALECEFVDGALVKRLGKTEVQIHRERRGRAGCFLVARIGFPPLGLGLGVVQSRGRSQLSTRDAQQTRWLNDSLQGVLLASPPCRAGDDFIACEVADAGLNSRRLQALATRAIALAEKLEQALEEIPPPSDLAEHLPAWREAARHVGGTFEPAQMRITMARDRMRLQMHVHWDEGRPAGLYLQLWPEMPIDARHHLDWDAHARRPFPHSELRLDAFRPRPVAISIDRRRVSLLLPVGQSNLGNATAQLEGLASLGQRLQGRRGTYR